MELVSAKCPNCGANLNISTESEKVICEYCRQTIIVDEAIATYKLKVSGIIGVDGIETNLDLITSANELMNMGEYLKAKKKFLEFSEKCPDKYHGWLGLLICRTRNFTIRDNNILFENDIKKFYEHFLRTATDDIKNNYLEKIENYMFPERIRNSQEEIYNSIRDEISKQKEVNTIPKKVNVKNIILDLLKYLMVFFSFLIIIGSILEKMILSLILWITNFLIFLPPIRKKIVNKSLILRDIIRIISVVLPFFALIVFFEGLPDIFEDEWVSSNNMIVNLYDGFGKITLNDGRTFYSNYTDTMDDSGNYLISIIDENKNIEYVFKYENNNDIITFCLIEEDECSLYFRPSTPSDLYEYNY